MYKSEEKIIDVRTNLIHIVECVDHYDDVSLVFTKDKKYIPIEFVKKCIDTPINSNENEVLDFFKERQLTDGEFDVFLNKMIISLRN
jgi:hypothetical protein